MRRILAVALLLVCFVVAACGSSSSEPPGASTGPSGALTEEELEWIRASAEWRNEILASLDAAFEAFGAALIDP